MNTYFYNRQYQNLFKSKGVEFSIQFYSSQKAPNFHKLQKLMNSQISRKNQSIRSQIRRKHIEELFEKQRKALMKKNKNSENKEQNELTLDGSTIKKYLQKHSIEHLYANLSQMSIYDGFTYLHKQNNNFEEEFITLILQNIDSMDSVNTLGFFIVHIAVKKEPNCDLSILFQKYQVCEILYSKLKEFMNKKGGLKMTKLLLTCLKNCAFMNVPSLRNPQLLQQYLPILVKELLSQTSTMIILSNLSEILPLDNKTIQFICNQAHSVQPLTKLATGTIIMNFITLSNQNDLMLCFPFLCSALQHLIINSHKYSTTQGYYCFEKLGCLIERFPQQQGQLLIKLVKQSRLQDFLLLNMQFAASKKKTQAFRIVETIIDKLVDQSYLLKQMNFQLYDYVVEGLQYSDVETIMRSLKILIKIIHYEQKEFIYQFLSKVHELEYVLENLIYHKNQFIAGNAEILQNELRESFYKEHQIDEE